MGFSFSIAIVAAFTVLVFAGFGRASFSLGYTGLVAAVCMTTPAEHSAKHKLAWAFTHPVVLVAVVGATAQDVGGYPSMPWFPVVMCWALAYWLSRTKFVDKKPVHGGCVLLACLAFGTGLLQFVSSG